MPRTQLLTRREALQRAALATAAAALARATPSARAADSAPPPSRTHGLRLGVATISLKDATPAVAAGVFRQLELSAAGLFRTHAPFEKGTPDECRAAADAFRAAGVEPVTTSVVNLVNDEALARHAFDNVRAASLALMTCKPDPDSLPLVARLAREYDIRLAIHNHGPEDKLYPSPYEAWDRIQSLGAHVGLCLDNGHTMRARVDSAEAIRRCASRLYDFHLKDSLALPGAPDIPVEVGRGHIDIRSVLAALIEVKYTGAVLFEYERMGVNPALGLAESVGYVRGLLGAMA